MVLLFSQNRDHESLTFSQGCKMLIAWRVGILGCLGGNFTPCPPLDETMNERCAAEKLGSKHQDSLSSDYTL